jgi:cell division protein FtsL
MKRWYVLLIAVLLPLAAFLNVWQVFRYRELEKSIAALEDTQQELIEKNKRLIAGISVLQSPQRLEKLAAEELELEKLGPGRLIRIRIPEAEKEAEKEAPDG